MAHASIYKTANGKYRVCFEFGFDADGKRIRKYKTFAYKKDAQLAISKHDLVRGENTAIAPNDMRVKDWLEYWMENIYAPKHAETSVYAYANMIKSHILPGLGKKGMQTLKPMDIQRYYTKLMKDKGLSPNTVIKHHDLLNSSFKFAVKQEIIPRNPMDGVEKPKQVKHEARFYTAEELNKLLHCVKGDRLEVPVNLGAYLGLRREEICGLKWDDIDWEKQTLTVQRAKTQVGSRIVDKETKTYASFRKLHMPDALAKILREKKEEQDYFKGEFGEAWEGMGYIVAWPTGKPYRPNYISELFSNFLEKYQLPKIVLHELRHTFASLSNEAGVQEFNIGKALGHSDVGTTKKIYTHLFDEKHTAAVDAVAALINTEGDHDNL